MAFFLAGPNAKHETGRIFLGPRNLPDQLMGCSGVCPLDRINLSFSTERAQGHFLSPWSKSVTLYTKEPRHSLCVYRTVPESLLLVFRKKIANFFLSFSLRSE
jgi:hypothetical protein